MAARESGEGEQIRLGVSEHRGNFRVGPGEHGGDFGELLLNVFRIGLGEDGAEGLMQVKGTPKVANPEGWLEGCSSCLTLIQVSSVATLSLSR